MIWEVQPLTLPGCLNVDVHFDLYITGVAFQIHRKLKGRRPKQTWELNCLAPRAVLQQMGRNNKWPGQSRPDPDNACQTKRAHNRRGKTGKMCTNYHACAQTKPNAGQHHAIPSKPAAGHKQTRSTKGADQKQTKLAETLRMCTERCQQHARQSRPEANQNRRYASQTQTSSAENTKQTSSKYQAKT